MKNNTPNYFLFDYIFLIDEQNGFSKSRKNFSEKKNKDNILGVTLNHRNFNIKSKDFIKSEVEYLKLNHLMFSIKPTIGTKLKKIFKKKILLKKWVQLYFNIFIAIKYNIKNIVLPKNYKKFFFDNNVDSKIFYTNLKNIIYILKNDKLHSPIFKIDFNVKDINKKLNFIFLDKDKDILKFSPNLREKENGLFWLGFDKDFQDVPFEKKYNQDSWSKKLKKTAKGHPLFNKLKYCNRCCLPETWEGIEFDNYNICKICRLSEDKMNINWSLRQKKLKKILNEFKSKSKSNYDCLLPISGGKDSTFQSYVLTKKYRLNPLCVTHGQNWMTKIGRYNLENCLQQFDLDHLIFIPSRELINQVARKSVYKIGDACWHCHIGVGSFSIQSSIIWNLKLIVYGEAPADTDARGQHKTLEKVSPYRFLKESALMNSFQFSDKNLTKKKLSHWSYPSQSQVNKSKVKVIHLGQYIFWDEQKNIDFVVKNYGWKLSKVENTYKGYKSVECVMAGVHDYFNFIKRGIGRASIHASEDVRRGLISRQEGFELAKKYDTQKPHALKYYKKITGLNDRQIFNAIKKSKNISRFSKKFKY